MLLTEINFIALYFCNRTSLTIQTMKTINNILNGFCATMQDPDFEAFIQQIRDDVPGNPELNKEQEKELTSKINKNPKPQDLSLELAHEISCWINNQPSTANVIESL